MKSSGVIKFEIPDPREKAKTQQRGSRKRFKLWLPRPSIKGVWWSFLERHERGKDTRWRKEGYKWMVDSACGK